MWRYDLSSIPRWPRAQANARGKVTRHFYSVWFFQMGWDFFSFSHYDANKSDWHIEQGSPRFSGTLNLTEASGHSHPLLSLEMRKHFSKSLIAGRGLMPTLASREGKGLLFCRALTLPVTNALPQWSQAQASPPCPQ